MRKIKLSHIFSRNRRAKGTFCQMLVFSVIPSLTTRGWSSEAAGDSASDNEGVCQWGVSGYTNFME